MACLMWATYHAPTHHQIVDLEDIDYCVWIVNERSTWADNILS